jgi:hypothetical protein
MQKHPSFKKNANYSGICSFTPQLMPSNLPVSPYAFNRYLRKAAFTHSPAPSVKAYQLPCGCFVWVHSSGVRQLSALPF